MYWTLKFRILEETQTDPFYNLDEGIFSPLFIYIFAIIITIWIISAILSSLWVRRDLKNRGKDEIAYIIIVVLTNFIGLIIYLLLRDNETCEFSNDPLCEIEQDIREEEREEFLDEVEETVEEELEDIIDEITKEQ